MSGLVMTFKGSTSLITRSKRLRLPRAINDVPGLLPNALKLVYNDTGNMNETTV